MSSRRRVAAAVVIAGLLAAAAGRLQAQTEGAVDGRVHDAATGRSLDGAQVLLDDQVGAVTDTAGRYRVRAVRTGWHRVAARLIGYRGVVLDSVFVRAGATCRADFELEASAVELAPLVVTAPVDELLDPLATATEQKISAGGPARPAGQLAGGGDRAERRGRWDRATAGGRIGEESFILDGLGVKNQLDAASGGLGLRIPPDLLGEASLVTNGFSARYGQALSGLVNVVTRDPGESWEGRAAIETDRPFGGSLDHGLDRAAVRAGGPIAGGVGLVAAIDVTGRLDDDPVNAPPPDNPLDPRTEQPSLLPHNSGEQWNGAAKLVVPVDQRRGAPRASASTPRISGCSTTRLQVRPRFRAGPAAPRRPGERPPPVPHRPALERAARRGPARRPLRARVPPRPARRHGGLHGRRAHRLPASTSSARTMARALSQSPDPIAGLAEPVVSDATPWGVPAFFLTGGSRGDARLQPLRRDPAPARRHLRRHPAGRSVRRRRVGRAAGPHLPAGARLPAGRRYRAARGGVRRSRPRSLARLRRGADPGRGRRRHRRAPLRPVRPPQRERGRVARRASASVSPRFAVSTVLKGATVVASYGRFTQAPDYQFLVDAAFDDTTRTGRFRRGNPDLGFEQATQYEFSVRVRPSRRSRSGSASYQKRLDGLVASVPLGVNPGFDHLRQRRRRHGTGAEVLVERELRDGVGVRVAYTLQDAKATATDPFLLNRCIMVDPITGDTIRPARAEFPLDFDQRHTLTVDRPRQGAGRGRAPVLGVRPMAGLEGAVILRRALRPAVLARRQHRRLARGAAQRLPAAEDLDGRSAGPAAAPSGRHHGRDLPRCPQPVQPAERGGGAAGHRGAAARPTPPSPAWRRHAYAAHPETIPYESARYRRSADLNGDGYCRGGRSCFRSTSRRRATSRSRCSPTARRRLVRLGVELLF